MTERQVIERHITQGPYCVKSGETVRRKRFLQTGSTYGRIIFTAHAPMLSLEADAQDIHIDDCEFIGSGSGVAIEVTKQ